MIKNPKANLLILSAAPCCAVSSCQPPDTELLPGCLGAPGVCSLQSVAVLSWGGSGLAELCVVLPGRGGVLWSTNGSGLRHLAPRQGSARSERSGVALPPVPALAGSETWGLEKSCPDPGGLQGVPGSSRGPGCSHLQAERSQLLVLGRKHVLLSAGLRDELIRGSSGCSMKALPLSQTASGFVLPALPSAGVLPASADQGTSKHSSSFPPASQHPPLLHPALQTPCGELPLPCRAPTLGEWARGGRRAARALHLMLRPPSWPRHQPHFGKEAKWEWLGSG